MPDPTPDPTPREQERPRTGRVLVIGAGPGGLAAGAALASRGIPFEIVDEGRRPGGIWDLERSRTPMYETAHFISSRTLSGFPDFPMPDDYPDYPRHDQVLAYLEAYAEHRGLGDHIAFGRKVESASPEDGGRTWLVRLDGGEVREYVAVVVATGLAWHPNRPQVPGDFTGETYHSFDYREPGQFEGRRVLVVGGGNSGCDIACDAAGAAERAWLSLRRGYWFVPKYVLGKPADVFARQGPLLPVWLERRVFEFLIGKLLVGDLRKRGLPAPDHGILESHPIMNTRVLDLIGHGTLEVRPDLAETRGRTVVFTDGREDEVDVIVYATGYRRIFPFLEGGLSGEEEPLDLYLNVFHRTLDTLFFMGLFETDGGAYPLLHEQAHLVAGFLADVRDRPERAERFARRKAVERPPLRARNYVPSQRHDYYVTRRRYEKEVARTRRAMGWVGQAMATGLLLLSVPACGPDQAGPVPGLSVRDSAGVTIVESGAPAWAEAEGWRLAEEPEVVIGGEATGPEDQLFGVRGLARLSDGRIAVLNRATREVRVYSEEGRFLYAAGGEGDGPGEMRRTMHMARTRGDTLVVNSLPDLEFFGPEGRHGRATRLAWGDIMALTPEGFPFGNLREVLPDGSLFLWVYKDQGAPSSGPFADSVLVMRYHPDAHRAVPLGRWLYADAVATGLDGSRQVVTHPLERHVAWGVGGSPARPVAVVGHPRRPEIHVYGAVGGADAEGERPDRIIRWSAAPTPATPGIIGRALAQERERLDDDDGRRRFDRMMSVVPAPEELPYSTDLVVDQEENVWARGFTVDRREPAPFTVFDAEGRWLGEVLFPPGLDAGELATGPVIGSDWVLGVWRDELDVEEVRLYRLIRP